MSKVSHRIKGVLAGLALAGLSALTHATVISSSSNNPLAFSWSSVGGPYTLTGSGSLTVSGFNSSTLTVLVSLTNTTVAGGNPIGKNARLTQFGFGIDPNATGVTFSDASDAGMVGANLDNIPSLSTIEVCAYGGNNCSGGSNEGIYGDGGTDTFSLLLTGTWGDSVDIAPLGFKYQTSAGSYEFTTTSSSTTSTTSTTGGTTGNIPEPSSSGLVFMGLGLVGASFWMRRRQRR